MKDIVIPKTYNYVALFLALDCNYRCSYCINYFENGRFNGEFISGEGWVGALNRIVSRDDLPITLQGGEPSLHKDFIYILNNTKPELKIDILTNIQFDVDEFIKLVKPERLRRKSPYASIRVSYHPEVMRLDETLLKVMKMQDAGFSIGIWGVMHPLYKDIILEAQDRAGKMGIDFRTKEFLGDYDNSLYGAYKYEGACNRGFRKKCLCKTTELIIGPTGLVYRCHGDLYEGRKPVGSIFDTEFELEDVFRPCDWFGHCNPCDIKVKTNRFQQFGHTSVEVKDAQN
ncbi:MAG: radical SAM protein [Candidatus Omnitrophica bacterium]|nr:radical SAM protein [Candidatus Omnitrophota bacterium]MBU4590170.1 radical SAM protein [Candidatus Omnitrophota bacterium]